MARDRFAPRQLRSEAREDRAPIACRAWPARCLGRARWPWLRFAYSMLCTFCPPCDFFRDSHLEASRAILTRARLNPNVRHMFTCNQSVGSSKTIPDILSRATQTAALLMQLVRRRVRVDAGQRHGMPFDPVFLSSHE